ncbi:alpha-1,2-fucosyltransferase [Sporolactobacillus nakayamae]|uniref:Glycosyl transferase family 11 n=1 Tax=Sporolactobacillus nakayamae TaxID=269670 RepID=A0A1I2W333_9BACL|nr:alpha-1,2-fucosyltransferase [Sporolactobacillus nakayamae]SFG94456.1 Glycosyl transferase family 11 [Sporolactobacillus nakayamae]
MIYVRVNSGFGNQLFQYACAYSLAKKNHTGVVIEKSSYGQNGNPKFELDRLNIRTIKDVNPVRKQDLLSRVIFNKIRLRKKIGFFTKIIKESNGATNYDDSIMKNGDGICLLGYFQSEKYFKVYREDIIQMYQPNFRLSTFSMRWKKEIIACNSVAIHVRRGDYVRIGCTLDMDYYDNAINMINSISNNVHFFIFSDDINFVKKYFSKFNLLKISFVEIDKSEGNKDLNEFYLMSCCRHQIIANSTFSWWAAWLNENCGKIVIAPRVGIWKGDYYPTEWIQIKA